MSQTNIQERLDFFGFNAERKAELAKLKAPIEAVIPDALNRFYDVIGKTPQVERFFRDDAHKAHAKNRQAEHWGRILEARFDETYFDSVRRIGKAHASLGLNPLYYIGGYA